MKFLVDECVGPKVALWLRQNNYDVFSIFDDMRGATDNVVLKKASQENRILITSDKDFGDMIFNQKEQYHGVVLLRLLDQTTPNKIKVLEWLFEHHYKDLTRNFVVVTEKTVRIIQRRLER